MSSLPPPTGINGRPVAISPRMSSYAADDFVQAPAPAPTSPSGGGGGVFSFLNCTGGDHFFVCDGAPRHNEVDFDVNPTGVYVAVHTKQWQLAVERLKIYPREASTWVLRYGSPLERAGVGTSASGFDGKYAGTIAVASPRDGSAPPPPPVQAALSPRGPKILRWRMLPLHAALLFGAPPEVIKALIKAYPAGCSAHDDQGMLPLHLAFRAGCSEELVLILLEAYPEGIERADRKGRLPSQLAPKHAMSYGDIIGETFMKGPDYYYWASRVATADRVRSEAAMMRQIKILEENARKTKEEGMAMLDKTEQQLTEEIEHLSVENVELKERLTWYETKYDGADEKEKVLVDHTNSLAERLRLTSLSEEHLATKLAKLESRLTSKDTDMDEVKKAAAEEKAALEARIKELEGALETSDRKAQTLTENLEKKVMESNEAKVRFDKERQLFEKQIEASKECLMELIASSKEDKRMFEEDSKELRKQLEEMRANVQKASLEETKLFEVEELRRQMSALKEEVHKAASSGNSVRVSPSIEGRLDTLQREVASNTRSLREADEARLSRSHDAMEPEFPVRAVKPSKKAEEPLMDIYVSTKSNVSDVDQMRDDYECMSEAGFSHQSDVGTALALGELTVEQRLALEELDLGGTREEIAEMLGRVPGLTRNQVNLLVDVASSLTA